MAAGRTGGRPGGTRSDGGVTDDAPIISYPNYEITDPKALIGGTPKRRFKKNRKAIETYLELKESGLQPTKEQLDAMAAYIGWGSFGQELFNGSWEYKRPKQGWETEDNWLREHLGKDAWESAQASILNAHYTDPPTVSAIWRIAQKLGFRGGRVLEPSMGVGNFFGLMPRDLMANSQLTGIELDETTAGIAKLLYPDAIVRQMGYQDSKTADDFYDLVIGNWPFAKQGPVDRRYNRLSPSLHDYFFLKALDQVRPGGLVIGITSRFSMDKKAQGIRREMARKAELVTAIRLPTGAFDEYAGTSVVTDIIVLKKRAEPVVSPTDAWIETATTSIRGDEVEYNRFYFDNPDNVLGNVDFGSGTMTGRPGLIVTRQPGFESALERVADKVQEGVYEPRTTKDATRYLTEETKDRQQSVTVGKDGNLYQVQGDRLARLEDVAPWAVKDKNQTAAREAQIRALVGLRRDVNALFAAERDSTVGDKAVEALRATLKKSYQAFVAEHGPISESFGAKQLRKIDDPYYPELAALETKEGERWVPVAAMDRPTTRGKPKQPKPSVSDALVIARNERMDLDVGRVAELANVSREEAIKQLLESGAAFEAPDGSYVVSDQYLSGNVRRKLREAKAAMEEGKPGMERNIAELEKVVPKDIPYYNIEARMGASWIPVDVYGDFVRELLGVSGRSDPVPIRNVGGSWKVDHTPIFNRSEADRWTAYLSFRKALSAALNVRTVTIRTKDSDGNLAVDDEATKKANAKIAEIREEFVNWIWRSPERQVDLERVYNEVMNAMASPSFDGSFLSFDGMALQRGTSQFALRQHQVDAIYRGLVNRRGLYAHEVGTGKTYTIAGVAVESRRYGISRKPLIFAHNANSRAVSNGIKEMYPNAKVLYIDNLSPDTIDVRLRQIKMDDWDAVVVPHSLIDRFALSRESLMDLAKEDIDALEDEAYDAASEDNIPEHVVGAALAGDEDAMKKMRSQTAKDLVRTRNQIIANIEKQAMRASREGAVTFEELGVDQLIVDEAHLFKKPPIATRMTMRGLNKTASGRSIALNLLASYIKRTNNGAGVHLFTGTPITNTLTETFHVMRYVMDDEMKRDGLSGWDSWFNSFASETNDVEITSSGEYEPVTRLATFINVADLRRMMGNYMDIVFADDMPEFVPRKTASGKTMADKLTDAERDDLENGRSESAVGRPYKKIVVDSADMTPEQQNIMALLVERAKTFRSATRKVRKEIMLSGSPESPIIVETDASNAALDQRLFKDYGNQVYESGSPNSKAARAVKNTLKHYRESRLSTQVIFMDRGFGGQRGNFDLAKAIADDLVSGGIPRKEIAVVTGSTSNDRRAEIADAMNRAEIRVVIGNTQTLGVGVNMQENLRAMHHLDAPWTPADLEQRNGRGHRQGNKWNTVLEYRYLTERLDGRRWQVLAVKDRFIKSFLKADENVRVIEGDAVDDSEGGDIVSTLSEAAGDPRILIVKKLSADVEKLQARERMHGQAVVEAKRQAKFNKEVAEEKERAADLYEIEAETYETSRKERGFYAKIGDKEFSDRDAANAALGEFVKNEMVPSTEPTPFGEINGLSLAYKWTGRATAFPVFNIGNKAPRWTGTVSFNAFQQIASGFGRAAEDGRQNADYYRSSIANLSKQAEETFGRAEELKRKKDHLARVQLDMQLNPVPPPSWLRNGAPVGSIAHEDGKPYAVVGHRWTSDGYTVELQSEDGKTQKSVSYDNVTDNQGIALYEPHPFAPPEITAQTRQSRPSSTTAKPATVAQARAQLVTALDERNVTTLERAGGLVLHATDPTKTGAAGYVDGKGVIHLIPGNMDQDALSVAVHEAIHLARDDRFAEGDRAKVRLAHAVLKLGGLRNFVGNPGFSDLAQQVYRMAAEGNPVAVEAMNKAKLEARANPSVDVAEEAVAYLAQYADQKYPLVRRVLAAIRTALYRMGIKVNLTPADVRALALSALKARSKARATRVANVERLETAFANKHGWEALGDRRTDVLRRLPSDATLDDFERMAERALRASVPADAAEQERLWQEFQAVRAQFQARQPTETVFRHWFGKGTEGVTARDGKPIILYHGTNNPEFNRWDASRSGKASYHPTAGLGFFMTADKRAAARYGSRLLELHAKIDKPYYLTDADLTSIESVQDAARMRRKLMARGYDGAVVSAPGAAPYVIAFESKQVKHTTNENPTDSEDFRYSRAFHGTPHEFDSFTIDKLGTGEGAQAYGHGLYFTDSEAIAEFYRKSISEGNAGTVTRYTWKGDTHEKPDDPVRHALSLVYNDGLASTRKLAKEWVKEAESETERAYFEKLLETAESIKSKSEITARKGFTYEVELAPQESDYLLWDKPLAQQSDTVKSAMRRAVSEGKLQGDPGRWNRALTVVPQTNAGRKLASGEVAYLDLANALGSDQAASEYLHSIGVRGIKYLDADSRIKGKGNYNYVVFNDKDVTITRRYSRPGRAPRMDSPRVAAKVLGDIGELRDALKPAEKAKAKIDPRNWAQMLSDLKTDKRPAWLAFLTQDMLLQLANKHLPAADVRQFDDASERMDAYEAKIIQGDAFPMAERWQNLMTRDRQQADAMSRLIYMSTWLGVDPRKAAPKNKGAEWTRAKAAYDGLTNPEARKLYGEVLAFYESQTKRLFDELAARIERHSLPEPDKLAAKDMLRQEFERMKQEGPYAPLMRFGDLTVLAEPRKRGEKPVFATFESVTEQRAFADWLRSEGYQPRIGVKMEEIEKRNLPQGDFVGKMAGIIDKTAKGPEAKLLKDAMYQLFLRSMPEQAIRKHFIHRKFVPGYSSDALRTFATFARRSAKQTARLAHADKMSDALDRMAKTVREGAVDDPVAAGHLVNELDKSYQWAMNPTTATWASRLTHLGFMWHLGASPAHLLLNLTQQAQVTAPWLAGELAGKKGFGAVAGALLRANKDFIASNPFVDPAKRGSSANQARTRLEAEWGGDMGRALKALEEAGKTDKTQTYSIAGLSEEDNFLWTRPMTRKITQGAAWFFHVAEVINREASAIAAYRLGRQSGMSHEAAYDLARRAINETHFDYSPSNRARFMRGNVAKVVTLFKQYSLNVTWQLGRNAYLAARGASPQEKTVARTKLLGMLGVTFAMAGAVGLPFYGEVMWLLTQLLNAARDDDEPEWDADTTVRSLLDNALSPTGEQAVRRGLVNAFLGVDLSSRIKLDGLWWRGSDSDLQGKQAAYHAMEQLLGPVAGLGVRGFASANDAIDAILSGTSARGATWRAMEGAMPKVIKDISKAFRFQSEGATTFEGARVLEPGDLGSAGSVGQLLGFAPASLTERYAENRAMMNLQRRIQRQRDTLLDSYAMAYRQNDEEVMAALREDMAAFNKRYPGKKITDATLNQSLKAREKRREEIERYGGVALDKRLAGLLLEGVR
jgi:N12 class adenine-specific DNA methylase